jgi:hypothetical protein
MEKSVHSVSEFAPWINDYITSPSWYGSVEADEYGPWFRGQQDAAWSLLPKAYRDEYFCPEAADRRTMEEAREEFMVRAPALSDAIPGGDDLWDWYFLMQHFGAPTRLLDWTEGALIALYFAVKDNPGTNDAMVWALDPYELNRQVINRGEVFPVGSLAEAKDRSDVAEWLEILIAPKSPVAVLPIHANRRISTQHSCFTIFGADREGLSERADCLESVRIPGSRVKKVRRDLETCGIDETTVFPDLEGLGRTVSARWAK